MDKDKVEIINEIKRFKEENKIKKIIFFGSRATGKPTEYSDVDLIIITPNFKKLRSFERAPTIRLKWNLDYSVDMLCYTPEEFERKKKEPTIVREAIKSGIEI